MSKIVFRLCLFLFLFPAGLLQALPVADYTVARQPWADEYGNHRAVIAVDEPGKPVSVFIPWRLKTSVVPRHLIVVEAATGNKIGKVGARRLSSESVTLYFKPNEAGIYYLYYLPYRPDKTYGYFKGRYLSAKPLLYRPKDFIPARLISLEARTVFDSFYPMEVCATKEEEIRFLNSHSAEDFLLFCESRENPVRMKKQFPVKWINGSVEVSFSGKADKNEYFTFQTVLFGGKNGLNNVRIRFSDFRNGSRILPASVFTCFNTEGIDSRGRYFQKRVDVAEREIKSFWIGVDIPKMIGTGVYRGEMTVSVDGFRERRVPVSLEITDSVLADRGDGDLWRMSRLRWLNSTLGSDDSVMIKPFTPIEVNEKNGKIVLSILNRRVVVGKNGYPESIRVHNREILRTPVTLQIGKKNFSSDSVVKVVSQKPFAVRWTWSGTYGSIRINGTGTLEADGYMEYNIDYESDVHSDASVTLQYEMEKEFSEMVMGLHGNAVKTPCLKIYRWGFPRDSFWLGSGEGGLYCELKGDGYSGPLLNLYRPAPPKNWYNAGRGKVTFKRKENSFSVKIDGGLVYIKAGGKKRQRFAFIVTPVKTLNWQDHFSWRYYHNGSDEALLPDESFLSAGVNVVNIHHATSKNPYINYPFINTDEIKAFVEEAHRLNVKIKYYYTVRELSQTAREIWAFRSLDNEIYLHGNGGGAPWLREHLENDYLPAWYSYNGPQLIPDAALTVTAGESRLYNFYIEGLRWLMENHNLDGFYLDDVAFDRSVVKRMRRVMESVKSGALLDLHSNTGFSRGPALQYTEYFPYFDRIWFGESFRYDLMSPDRFAVESSGIPFGVGGEMLQNGGNPWRGMIFGMTSRAPWQTDGDVCDPRTVWKLWDAVGIKTVDFYPYVSKEQFAETGNKDILTAAYVSEDKERILVVFAGWNRTPKTFTPVFREDRLGIRLCDYDISFPDGGALQKPGIYNGTVAVFPKKGAALLLKKKNSD